MKERILDNSGAVQKPLTNSGGLVIEKNPHSEIDRLREENGRLRKALEKIEWNGPADYSIGVRTCPYCGQRGDVREESKWYQGHLPDCEIGKLLEEAP